MIIRNKIVDIRNYFLCLSLIVFFSCHAQDKPAITFTNETVQVQNSTAIIFKANEVTKIGRDIRSILHDSKNNYWFGTDKGGVYLYSEKKIFLFTKQDGLADDQIQIIQEDKSGNVWLGTGGYGVTRFDGKKFTAFTDNESLPFENNTVKDWNVQPDDVWFFAGGGAYRYSDNSFSYLPFPKADVDSLISQNAANRLSKYGVYSYLKDKKGNLWFGTQSMGVCCFNGKSFTWLTEKGLSGPAVRALFEDSKGNFWFGNNGAGLFKYDGKTLSNITDEKGLGNPEFLIKFNASNNYPGTMARVWTINEDNYGNIWIGTIDAGVWKYDGNKLTNYTSIHGLPSNSIYVIYKDKNGELLFGAEGEGVYKFNGTSFSEVVF